MTKRYFKATDGQITFFRATGMPKGFRFGYRTRNYIGFANANVSKAAMFPAVEIDDIEYKALVAAKKARVEAAGRDNVRDSSPQDAWVANDQLGEAV